jgi:hypothetical protein
MPLTPVRTCVCGTSLEGTNLNRRYCSTRCRNREKERRGEGSGERWAGRMCGCGAVFDDEIRSGRPAKKCPACREARLGRAGPVRSVRCAYCRASFETRHRVKLFCSSTCQRRANWKRKQTKKPPGPGRTGYRWRKLRAEVLAEEPDCWICGWRINPAVPNPEYLSPSVDHVVPLVEGGHPTDRSNLRAAHLGCNREREVARRRAARRRSRAA